jgi:DNA-binding NarL/FixJ family response regulator
MGSNSEEDRMVIGIAEPCPLRREALWRALWALGCSDVRELPLSLAGPGWCEGEEDLEVVLLTFRMPAGNRLGFYAALRCAHRPVRGVVLVEDPGPPHWGLAGPSPKGSPAAGAGRRPRRP